MERIAWALIRCQLESELAVELRICIETLWALPAPNTPFEVALLPSSVLVGIDGTVELGVPYPADQRYFHRYLAPELTRAETPTVVSAVYAVGALLFEAVSGRPFESSEGVERELGYLASRAQATSLPPDAVEMRLLELAVRATRGRAEERWATPEVFTREIDRVAGHRTATREELAGLVHGWVRRRRSRVRTPNVAEWRKASVFPAPSVPRDGNATGLRRRLASSRNGTLAERRTATLRGYTLDLSSYPPPRPAAQLEHDAAAVRTGPAVTAPDAPASFEAEQIAPATPEPASGMRPAANAVRRPTDTRAAALITALVVAIPLLGMTLWNWRASAQAATRTVPREEPARVHRVALPAVVPAAKGSSGRHAPSCASCRGPARDASIPRIDLTREASHERPVATRRAPKRAPTFKPRGPFDYGI